MIRHLARLVWNRKGQNLLLALEICLSFLVLVGATFFTVLMLSNWWAPLGFTTERLWAIEMSYPQSGLPRPEETAETRAARSKAAQTVSDIRAALRALPRIERVGESMMAPYDGGTWITSIGNPTQAQSNANIADDQFADVAGITMLEGRWFSPDDDGLANPPAVINRRLARDLFGTEDVIGRLVPPALGERWPQTRVVGLIEDFRHGGEVMQPGNYIFFRLRTPESLPNVLTIRVSPGTTAEFEQTIADTLQGIARDWRFDIQPIEARRATILRQSLIPLTVIGIVAAFLLLMVALGLTGVVWQSVTRRFNEFGLRRANGATGVDVRRQVLIELAILTTLALIVGVAVAAQLPVLALADPDLAPPTGVFVSSIVLSALIIYLLTLLCGWYPSRLATQIHPAEALHYE